MSSSRHSSGNAVHTLGLWRRTATDDPRDHTWLSRLLRWFLNHPAVLIALFVVALVAIFAILLILGPPGGWK